MHCGEKNGKNVLDIIQRNKINMYKILPQKCGNVDKNVDNSVYELFLLFHIQSYTDFYIVEKLVKIRQNVKNLSLEL